MLVVPNQFASAMSERWVNVLGNALNTELVDAWAMMAQAFNDHISGKNLKPITVFPLPTGTGKTQGLSLYCSMLAEVSNDQGVLIVTAFKDEGNNIADCINEIAGAQIAVAEHGDNRNKAETICSSQILVITHSAYQRAMDAESSGQHYKSKWDVYKSWAHGRRKLTVIDEAIDITQSFDVKLEELRLVLSLIPPNLPDEYTSTVEAVRSALKMLGDLSSGVIDISPYELLYFPNFKGVDFTHLCKAISVHVKTHHNDKAKGVDLNKSLVALTNKVLSNLEEIINSWSIYYRLGAYHGLMTTRFVLPLELNDVVVLDATAPANPVTRILEDHTELVELSHVKTYENVTLHISTGHRVGKQSMQELTNKDWGYIFDQLCYGELQDSIAPLLCVHKDVEDKLANGKLPKDWSVMHWGAINGINEWSNCDAVVIYGLQYLSDHVCASTLMAFLDWSYSLKGKSYSPDILRLDSNYIKNTYKWRHIIVSMVQAINRAHCRKMIQGGHCPPTDIYLFIKSKSDKEKLEHHIKELNLMPNIDIQDWDGPNVETNSQGLNKTERKILDTLQASTSDTVEIIPMLDRLDINRTTFENYVNDLNSQSGKFYEALHTIGWQFLSAKDAKLQIDRGRRCFIRSSNNAEQ